MKIVVPYCKLHPATVKAVWDAVDEREEIVWGDTSGSDTAYYELLARCWAERETFVVLEQDKIPAPGALRELHDCPEPWCTYPVPMAHNGQPCEFVSLSCTKFAAELMDDWPELMERVGLLEFGYGRKHWNRLDMAMALEVGRRIGNCHWHELGRVAHEHQSV